MLLQMADEMPFGFITDKSIFSGHLSGSVFSQVSYAGLDGLQSFYSVNRFGNSHHLDFIGPTPDLSTRGRYSLFYRFNIINY